MKVIKPFKYLESSWLLDISKSKESKSKNKENRIIIFTDLIFFLQK